MSAKRHREASGLGQIQYISDLRRLDLRPDSRGVFDWTGCCRLRLWTGRVIALSQFE